MTDEQEKCPKCDKSLIEVKSNFHATVRTEGKISGAIIGYTSFCKSCNLPFKRKKHNRSDTGWLTTELKKENLCCQIIETKIDTLEIEISKYSAAYKKWKKFISYKAKQDKLHFFNNSKSDQKGMVLVREEEPILDYITTNYLYNKLVKLHDI